MDEGGPFRLSDLRPDGGFWRAEGVAAATMTQGIRRVAFGG